MKRIILMATVALVIALMLAIAGGPASASSPNASERACLGAFVSENAPFPEAIREETRTFHPFGQNIVSPFASTCEFQGGE
jgi:hypothetical protein